MDQPATATCVRLHCTAAGLYANNLHPLKTILGAVYADNSTDKYQYTPPKNFLDVCSLKECMMHASPAIPRTLPQRNVAAHACIYTHVLWIGCSLPMANTSTALPSKG
jgi:hypothetical protein